MIEADFHTFPATGVPDEESYTSDGVLVEQTRCQMVLGSLERCLAERIIQNLDHIDLTCGPASKALAVFRKTYNREPKSKEELIRKSYIDHLLNISRYIYKNKPEGPMYERLNELINALQIFSTRSNTYAHSANKYLPVYWARTQALALDPVILQLGFIRVLERHAKALKGEILLDEILTDSDFKLIPNNLPKPDFGTLYGRDATLQELREFIVNPRKPSICIYGAGGTGKTACALSVLNDLCISEIGYQNLDLVLMASLKDEFLEYAALKREEVDATWNGVKRQLVTEFQFLAEEHEQLPTITELSADIAVRWEEFTNILSACKVLLWIDNLETLQTDLSDGFSRLEESLPREWKVLITSRVRVRDTSKIISLSELDLTSATRLFLDEYNAQVPSGITYELATAYTKSLYCNPLAIKNAISYHRKSGRDIGEAVAASRDAIVNFSYRNLVTTLMDTSRIICESLLVFGSSSKYELGSFLGIDQDDLIASILELQDLGLVHLTIKGEGKYMLSDNFRGYLSVSPISLDTRKSASDFIRTNAELHSNAMKSDANVQNILSFYFINPHTRSESSIFQKVLDAINALRFYYASNKREDSVALGRARSDLRRHLVELEAISSSIGSNANKHPEIFRLIGLIYYAFVDMSSCEKYLEKATALGDANAALTHFYIARKRSDREYAVTLGFRLIDILDPLAPNDKKYIKFMTSFLYLLKEQERFDEMIEICSDWHNKGLNANFYLSFLAAAYSMKARSVTASLADQGLLASQCKWFLSSIHYLGEAISNLSAYDGQVLKEAFYTIRDVSAFIKKSACFYKRLPFKFLRSSLDFFEKNWDTSLKRIDLHGTSKVNASDEMRSDIVAIFREVKEAIKMISPVDPCQDPIDVDLSGMTWARAQVVALNIIKFTGFENSLAIMKDSATGKTFRLHCSTYNESSAARTDLGAWSSLRIGDTLRCAIYAHSNLREQNRDRVLHVAPS